MTAIDDLLDLQASRKGRGRAPLAMTLTLCCCMSCCCGK